MLYSVSKQALFFSQNCFLNHKVSKKMYGRGEVNKPGRPKRFATDTTVALKIDRLVRYRLSQSDDDNIHSLVNKWRADGVDDNLEINVGYV